MITFEQVKYFILEFIWAGTSDFEERLWFIEFVQTAVNLGKFRWLIQFGQGVVWFNFSRHQLKGIAELELKYQKNLKKRWMDHMWTRAYLYLLPSMLELVGEKESKGTNNKTSFFCAIVFSSRCSRVYECPKSFIYSLLSFLYPHKFFLFWLG